MSIFEQVISTVAAPVLTGVNRAVSGVMDFSRTPIGSAVISPVMNRLKASGLAPFIGLASGGAQNANTNVMFKSAQGSTTDWKVRISVAPESGIFYNSGDAGIMAPLRESNGVIFPYTPNISVSYQANYYPQRFTHSNYNHMAYENSEVQVINISAEFTAQNAKEASYVLASIYFFRAATKMFFGASNGPLAGNPPPLVFLDGYGEHYFKKIPCVVTAFTHTMPQDVDYISAFGNYYKEAKGFDPSTGAGEFGNDALAKNVSPGTYSGGSVTKIPTISTFQISLQPVYSKLNLTEFNLNDFAQGKLINKGFL